MSRRRHQRGARRRAIHRAPGASAASLAEWLTGHTVHETGSRFDSNSRIDHEAEAGQLAASPSGRSRSDLDDGSRGRSRRGTRRTRNADRSSPPAACERIRSIARNARGIRSASPRRRRVRRLPRRDGVLLHAPVSEAEAGVGLVLARSSRAAANSRRGGRRGTA